MHSPTTQELALAHTDALKDIVLQAGKEILQVYNTEFAVQTKQDESPLTQADLQRISYRRGCNNSLRIFQLSQRIGVPPFSERGQWQRYWLVDPLDGTKEFVSRNGDFTVNIALIEDNAPALGWVGVPVQGRLFFGNALAGEAWVEDSTGRRPLRGKARQPDDEKLTVVASRNHGGQRLEDYLAAITEQFPSTTRIPVGSSLKLCTLASGEADIYPRLGPTSEWDIGAAQAVLCAAGGRVFCADGESLGYNQKENILNPEFIAVADGQFPWAQVLPQLPSG